jgi:hypothetical protein
MTVTSDQLEAGGYPVGHFRGKCSWLICPRQGALVPGVLAVRSGRGFLPGSGKHLHCWHCHGEEYHLSQVQLGSIFSAF